MVTTREAKITALDGGTSKAHVAIPDSGEGPGILLLQEIFGVGDFIKAKADELATLGFVVLCPDVFWRVEPGIALPHDEAALNKAFGFVTRYATEVDDATKLDDLGAAFAALRDLPEVAGACGVLGYCLGGLLAFLVACHHEPDACVSYYGSGITDRLNECDDLTCPILFHFGGNDPYIPNEQVDAIRVRLADRPNVEIQVQHQAGHAFENHLAPQFHDPAAAAASWPATVAFFERTLR